MPRYHSRRSDGLAAMKYVIKAEQTVCVHLLLSAKNMGLTVLLIVIGDIYKHFNTHVYNRTSLPFPDAGFCLLYKFEAKIAPTELSSQVYHTSNIVPCILTHQ